MLRFFDARSVLGIDLVEGHCYRRTVRDGDEVGVVQVTCDHLAGEMVAEFWNVEPRDAEARLRRMFDLDADLETIHAHLSTDPFMVKLIAARPALRVPGGWDPLEIAMRTVLGQQVSIVAARQLNRRLVERCGYAMEPPFEGLTHVFPNAEAVVNADLSNMGMPGARAQTLKAVATAHLNDPLLFRRSESAEATIARLRSIKGIGDWSANYIAIRACREPDGFPAGDVGILRGLSDEAGKRPTPLEAREMADQWRPWRSYAAQHIWAHDQ